MDKKHHIELVAINLTEEQFKGFCEGNEIVYWQRAMKKSGDSRNAIESAKWWQFAFDKYKHLCKEKPQ